MKKLIYIFGFIVLLIVSIFFISNNTNANNEKKTIYFDSFVNATLLNEVKNTNEIEFKCAYPKNASVHEYEFNKNDLDNINNSQGLYLINDLDNKKFTNIANKHYLNSKLSTTLLKNSNDVIDIHYSLSPLAQKNIFVTLTTEIKKYVNPDKVKTIIEKFDNLIKQSKENKYQKNLISIHQAWNYVNKIVNHPIYSIGDNESNIAENAEVNKLLTKLNHTYTLISEQGEELTTNETKLISKYNLKNIKLHTFETELKDAKTYFEQLEQNFNMLENKNTN